MEERKKRKITWECARDLSGETGIGDIVGRGIHALVTRPTTDDNYAHKSRTEYEGFYRSWSIVDRQFAVTINSRNVPSGKFPE